MSSNLTSTSCRTFLTSHISSCFNGGGENKPVASCSTKAKDRKSKRSRNEDTVLKPKNGNNRTMPPPFKKSPTRQEEDNQDYDSDDCSLGSLGDRNEVQQDFFLRTPQEVFSSPSNGTRESLGNGGFFNTRTLNQSAVPDSTRRRRRVFLKPRRRSQKTDDLDMPSLF